MQTATSETESKSLDLSICVHHYTLRAPCPKGQGINFWHSREFSPDRSWDLRGILHPADNRPRLLVLTAIAVPTWVGLLVFAGLFLDTAWDATPVLPPAIGPRCVAATVWPTLPVSAQRTWSHAVLQTLVLPSL